MEGRDRMTPVRRVRERRNRKGAVRILPPVRTPLGEYRESVGVLEEFFERFGSGKVPYIVLLESDFLELDGARSEAYDRCFKCGVIDGSPEFEEIQDRYSRLISRIDYDESCRPEDSQGAIIIENGIGTKVSREEYNVGPLKTKTVLEDREPCRISPEVKKHIRLGRGGSFGE